MSSRQRPSPPGVERTDEASAAQAAVAAAATDPASRSVVNPAVLAALLTNAQLDLPTHRSSPGSLRFVPCESFKVLGQPRQWRPAAQGGGTAGEELSLPRFTEAVNHHLAGAGRVTIYFDRVRLTIEPHPASRILTVTVLVSSIDPSVNKSRAYIADLRHVPGAFDPAAAIPEALARDGLRIFGGGASWRDR